MANNPAVALTTISGGINRLRTKGAASKDSLFDLLNGYVTQAGTTKVRPGTIRNANIAAYSGAGTTKGLLAYQSALHVFSNTVVPVPPGYALHVLNHPASSQSNITTGAKAATLGFSFNSSAGLGGETVDGGFSVVPPCAIAVGSLSIAGFADGTQIGAAYTHAASGNHTVVLAFSGTLAQSYFTDVKFTDRVTTLPVTLTSASADVFSTTSTPGWTVWRWTNGGNLGGASGAMTFDGVPLTVTAPIPLTIKEIHFAAPYLGGIYVVAEFNTNAATAAQFGSTFHFWVQSSTGGDNSNTWQKGSNYRIGDIVIPNTPNGLTYVAARRTPSNPIWTPSTAETVGNIVEPTIANGFQYAVTAVQGAKPTTGATEPTWPTTNNAIVNENSALASDQTVTLADAATSVPTPTVPPRYTGGAGFA